MKILSRLANRFGWMSREQANAALQNAIRGYAMGAVNRLTADWMASPADANQEVRLDLQKMRDRARDQERNNDYIRKYFHLVSNNVLGAFGIGLQMKITENVLEGGKAVSRYDDRANRIIEDCWAKWSRKEFCTITKSLTWRDLQEMVLISCARDGAMLLKKHATPPFGLSLEPMEHDHLDTNYCQPETNGVEVKLGVQFAKTGEIDGYWLFPRHPGSLNYGGVTLTQRKFYSAGQILHVYRPTRAQQATGVPWIHTCGTRLKNLSSYEEATVIDARVSAAKGMYLKRTAPVEYTGLPEVNGQRQMEVSPGTIEELPVGVEPFAFTPNNPNADGPAFIKSQLRGIASGLGVSYNSLANDLEGVNYSSIRAGLLEEREEWKSIQQWFIDWFIQPVFEDWLRTSLGLGAITDGLITLPPAKFDKFNRPEWKPRRWDWVDPLKDMQASVLAIDKGLTSRRQVIAEGGGDIENTFADQKADNDLAKLNGLDFKAESPLAAKAPKGSEPAAALTAKEE